MKQRDWTREVSAIVPHARDGALEVSPDGKARVPDAAEVVHGDESLAHRADASVEDIVCLCALEYVHDPFRTLRQWRRIQRVGGNLIVVFWDRGVEDRAPHHFPCSYLQRLLALVGGYEVTAIEPVVPGETWILRAERSLLAEVRGPLTSLATEFVEAAHSSDAARCELLFQVGAILLEGGSPKAASACFRAILELNPDSADGRFGLGASLYRQGCWGEAKAELARAVALQPENREALEWLARAHRRAGSVEHEWSPASPEVARMADKAVKTELPHPDLRI